jgi:hypothetical protein
VFMLLNAVLTILSGHATPRVSTFMCLHSMFYKHRSATIIYSIYTYRTLWSVIISISIYLFTCKLNSPRANYKASARRKNVHKQKQTMMIIITLLLVIIVPLTQI